MVEPSLPTRLWEFGAALAPYLWAVVGGGAIAAVWEWIKRYQRYWRPLAWLVEHDKRHWIAYVLILAGFVYASFQAFDDVNARLRHVVESQSHQRLPRRLAYSRTELGVEEVDKIPSLKRFSLGVHNNGAESLKWWINHLEISVGDNNFIVISQETGHWAVAGSEYSELPINFAAIEVPRSTKAIVATIEVSYDDDPPVGVRHVYRKVEFPIAWFDTQQSLFNTVRVIAHEER